ncbi:uncharacterized protein EI97DRAFT_429157 [Westerdykella ornata]|uniref:Rhodopsin domain-containing protein n=1 Tax=Westerdykella ornata TaxID=318751 RepID=A0A6A6JWU3_WESOR|nr:uncharacterized protein EI97DRAFT_429157 [Westerdykella ornata]KAF2281080.1 hypothetical protein EI97DRAFT_429157 [Westerdykella ornata]
MADSNGPKLVISLWVMTSVSFLFMNLRFFCKGVYTRQLRVDDAVLLLSWFLTLIYTALITVSAKYGMGKRHDDLDMSTFVLMYKFLFLGEFFTLLAIPASKTSFAITLLRIATKKWQKAFIWFVIVTLNIVYWVCAILLLVQCQPIAKNWDKDMPGSCWNSSYQDNYSIFAGAYSALLDFVLATFPCVIIWNLQMNKKEKIGVTVAMSLGCLAGITASVKTSYLPGVGNFKDLTYDLADLLIWSMAEVAVTIMAASIPFFRVLLRYVTSSYVRSKPQPHSYRLESYGGGRRSVKEIVTLGGQDDDLSERSILRDPQNGALGGHGAIVKSSEIRVEFNQRRA